MPKRFKTSENLIDLLVGQSLYANADVAVRELLQNAEDACHLQSLAGGTFSPEIVVSFSVKENWFEVSDNGLGMDDEVFEDSFATIGASKSNSPRLQELLARAAAGNRPIGQFGIGILSCFGVADIIEIRSRADGSSPVSVRIRDRHAAFEELSDHRPARGTTIRLFLRSGGPMTAQQIPAAVSRYVRHAQHIWLENVDAQQKAVAPEQWLISAWKPSSETRIGSVATGYLQLSDAWDNLNQVFDSQLLLCNGGFFVKQYAFGVLPDFALGFRGEIDVHPGSLSILMNREGFKQDPAWTALVSDLTAHYRARVAEKLNNWCDADLGSAPTETLRAIQRAVYLMLRTQLKDIVGQENVRLAESLLPRVILLADGRPGDVDKMLSLAREHPPLYAFRTDEQQQVQKSFSDRGQNVQLTETVRSLDLRISLLRLNGFVVVRSEPHHYTLNYAGGSHGMAIHDFDVLTSFCAQHGLSVSRVQDAPVSHTRIGSSPDADAITGLFDISADLKIQSVTAMTDAIIADFNGYILNVDNEEIRKILHIMPAAVGNPLRKALLSAYFALSTYKVSTARQLIFGLIIDPDFDKNARRTTGKYFRIFLEERVQALLGNRSDGDE